MDSDGFNPRQLREYAEKADPTSLEPKIYYTHTDHTVTVYDRFPKARRHYLLLPRLVAPWKAAELTNLRTLLQGDKARARTMLELIAADARLVKEKIEHDIIEEKGFKWGLLMGFHPLPSMEHLHLHIISDDFCGEYLKTKKNYNSFNPQVGFFLKLDDVLEWFEIVPSRYAQEAALSPSRYKPLLEEDLVCHHCQIVLRNMPRLKEHLQDHCDKKVKNHKAKEKLYKRKRLASAAEPTAESSGASKDTDSEPATKKRAVEASGSK